MIIDEQSVNKLTEYALGSVGAEELITNGGGHPSLVAAVEKIASLTADETIHHIAHDVAFQLKDDGSQTGLPTGSVVAVTDEFIYTVEVNEKKQLSAHVHRLRVSKLDIYFRDADKADLQIELEDGSLHRLPYGVDPTPRAYRDTEAMLSVIKQNLN